MSTGNLPNGASAPVLPPSSSSNGGSTPGGALSVTVLSAYDLPAREQPLSVSLSCLGQSVSTGAPSARHKDRNSFKFPQAAPIQLEASLQDLHKAAATLTVNYRTTGKNLAADIQLNSLKIHETTWLILNLGPYDDIVGDDETVVAPTLRLQVRLEGPYRPEIGALLTLGKAWFGVVDQAEGGITSVAKSLPALPDKKYFLVPAVPLATALVVLSPIVIGVLVVGLPFLLPLIVVVASTLVGFSGILVALYASTASGREYVGGMLSPLVHTILSTNSGQRLVYETGPRPTPVSVARIVLPKDLMGKLIVSLLIDLIGSSSYLLPFVGEGLDLAWAPTQTILIMAMYDTVTPSLKYVSFVEEILPFTDVVPSATIGWLIEFGPQVLSGGGKQQSSSTALANANTAALLGRRQ
jgi:hypothetical protein